MTTRRATTGGLFAKIKLIKEPCDARHKHCWGDEHKSWRDKRVCDRLHPRARAGGATAWVATRTRQPHYATPGGGQWNVTPRPSCNRVDCTFGMSCRRSLRFPRLPKTKLPTGVREMLSPTRRS